MTATLTWLPQPDDIAVPKGNTHGVWCRVVSSGSDKVTFVRVDEKGTTELVNRLSTFLDRYDLLRAAS